MNGGLVVLVNSGGGVGGNVYSNLINNGGGGVLAVEPVQATIWHCLNNYAFSDACFLAERVHAESPSDETLHTLSTAYYRSGSRTRTYVLLQTASLKSPHQMTPKNRYLFALVSFELEKYAEAESALLKSIKHDGKSSNMLFEQIEKLYGDLSAFALKLYALICVHTERSNVALDAFVRCLKLNPFLWNAYEYVCRLGGGAKAQDSSNNNCSSKGSAFKKGGSRVFQLPDALANSTTTSTSSSNTITGSNSIQPSTYIPILIGSTAASLILCNNSPVKSHNDGLCPHPTHYTNNQNYYKDSSLNASNNSSVFQSTGVLHPSNRSNIKPSKRNLFTSTPMNQNIGGSGGGNLSGAGGNNNANNLSGNNFGIIPLHLMDASTVSTVNTSSIVTAPGSAHHHIHMMPCVGSSPCAYSSSPIIPDRGTGGGGGGSGMTLVHSPVIGDFSDELGSANNQLINSGVLLGSGSTGGSDQPRAKKPCLRTPWQQQVSTATNSSSSNQQQPSTSTIGTVTITQNHTSLRRSSRLFTHVHLKENNKQTHSPLLQTPPSSNNVSTPDNNASPGSNTRRSSSKKQQSSVLKPKLRLNNSSRNNSGQTTSASTTSTVTGDDNSSPVVKCESSLESSGSEFYRMVAEKSVADEMVVIENHHQNQQAAQRLSPHDWVGVSVEAFRNGVDPLLHILSNLSTPYTSQNAYNCRQAISQYQRLKPSQYETGWVFGNIARCYFELGNYEESVKYYRKMMDAEPWRTEGLEWLSTAYWHLQRETDLSSLAQDLMKANRTTEVATWVAAGNCFSLHKEHETAIKFFKRAIQVNKYCAYAYTLLGHEYVVTEELEKAMRCFRSATRIDGSHYNAWYGMGMIFYKQERFDRAEVYYKKALSIHPNNSVLLCHLGVVQHALGRPEKSLATFDRALDANKNDPLCKFHRASVLFGIGKLDEALDELEQLKEIVPKESLVYFLIAKIFSKKGDTHKALLHFSWATDLDPKGANNQIKESIEPVLNRVSNPSTAAPVNNLASSSVTNALLTTANSSALEPPPQPNNNVQEDDDDEDDDDDDDDDDEDEDDDVEPNRFVAEGVVTRNMRNNSNNRN